MYFTFSNPSLSVDYWIVVKSFIKNENVFLHICMLHHFTQVLFHLRSKLIYWLKIIFYKWFSRLVAFWTFILKTFNSKCKNSKIVLFFDFLRKLLFGLFIFDRCKSEIYRRLIKRDRMGTNQIKVSSSWPTISTSTTSTSSTTSTTLKTSTTQKATKPKWLTINWYWDINLFKIQGQCSRKS